VCSPRCKLKEAGTEYSKGLGMCRSASRDEVFRGRRNNDIIWVDRAFLGRRLDGKCARFAITRLQEIQVSSGARLKRRNRSTRRRRSAGRRVPPGACCPRRCSMHEARTLQCIPEEEEISAQGTRMGSRIERRLDFTAAMEEMASRHCGCGGLPRSYGTRGAVVLLRRVGARRDTW
jgi:hypothetical protein